MPRVISDELYDQLMGCVQRQRLLGVMGMLEKMRDESVSVYESIDIFGNVWLPKSEDGVEDAKN